MPNVELDFKPDLLLVSRFKLNKKTDIVVIMTLIISFIFILSFVFLLFAVLLFNNFCKKSCIKGIEFKK